MTFDVDLATVCRPVSSVRPAALACLSAMRSATDPPNPRRHRRTTVRARLRGHAQESPTLVKRVCVISACACPSAAASGQAATRHRFPNGGAVLYFFALRSVFHRQQLHDQEQTGAYPEVPWGIPRRTGRSLRTLPLFSLILLRTALEGIFPQAWAAVGYPTAVGYRPTAAGCPPNAVGYPPTAVSIRSFFTASA